MKILIAYNAPGEMRSCDHVCHEEVLEQVAEVEGALLSLGHSVARMGFGRDLRREVAALADADADLVFNLCESINENAALSPCFAGLVQLLGVSYTGSPPAALTATAKPAMKAILSYAGIPTPQAQLVNSPEEIDRAALRFPVIVKLAWEDGSIGLTQDSVAATWPALQRIVRRQRDRYRQPLLVEQYLDGQEFNVGILGNEDLHPLPVAMVNFPSRRPGQHGILTYDAKWIKQSPEYSSWNRIIPAPVAPAVYEQIVALACRAYKTLGLRGYGRVDVRSDGEGRLYVLDVNANPDLCHDANLPPAALAAGLSYPELIDWIARLGLEAHGGGAAAAPELLRAAIGQGDPLGVAIGQESPPRSA